LKKENENFDCPDFSVLVIDPMHLSHIWVFSLLLLSQVLAFKKIGDKIYVAEVCLFEFRSFFVNHYD
jgi:hypothetical protein